jgi:hypothetical protein
LNITISEARIEGLMYKLILMEEDGIKGFKEDNELARSKAFRGFII